MLYIGVPALLAIIRNYSHKVPTPAPSHFYKVIV